MISFLNAFPHCATQNGNFLLEVLSIFGKLTNIHCAVSGLK